MRSAILAWPLALAATLVAAPAWAQGQPQDGSLGQGAEQGASGTQRSERVIQPYIEASQVISAQLSPGDDVLTFTTNLEHIGDIIDKNLMELATKKIRNRYAFSPEGMAELRVFHARVLENLGLALNVFTTRDIALARRLVAEKTAMREAEAIGFAKVREQQQELGERVRALLARKGFKSVAAEGFEAPGVVVCYTTDASIKNGSKFAAQGLQIAAGVPLQCDEPADFQTFRLGLFGLDKLGNIERTVATLEQALDKVLAG